MVGSEVTGGGVRRYVATVCLAGSAPVALGPVLSSTSLTLSGVVAALVALLFASTVTPLRMHRGSQVRAFTVEAAVFIAMLFAVPVGYVPSLHALATITGHAASRRGTLKTAYNAGQVALMSGGGALAFLVVGPGPTVLHPRSVLAAATALLAYELVNYVTIRGLFHRLGADPGGAVPKEARGLHVIVACGNLVFGLVIVLLTSDGAAAVLLAGLLLVGLHVGYRGLARVAEEHDRNDRLHVATQSVAAAAGSPETLERFCDQVALLFGAERASLHLLARSSTSDVDLLATAEPLVRRCLQLERAVHVGSDDIDAAKLLRSAGHRDGMAAPLVIDDVAVGALVVYDRQGLEPWNDSDAKLLASLANEAAVAVKNVELVASLEEESRKLRNIVTAASDGIVMVDEVGVVVTWNPAMERVVGKPASDAIGRPWYEVVRSVDSPDGIEGRAASAMIAALSGRRIEHPLDLHVARGTEQRWVRCSFSPIDRDEERGAVLVARDVTSEVEVEQLKSDFIATVSHELRTPLTPLKGFLSTVQHRWHELTSEQIDEILHSMSRQVDRLEALVGDLLVIADIDRGALGLQPAPTDLVAVAQRAVDVEAAPFDRARVRIEEPLGGSVPALADVSAVTRIARALVSNALKHTGGTVTVRVGTHGSTARLDVVDEGPGIGTWDEQRAFERFGRLGDHLTRTQGPGLGLAIARGLADQLGGSLELRSAVGQGSTFTLGLPLAGDDLGPEGWPQPGEASRGPLDGETSLERTSSGGS